MTRVEGPWVRLAAASRLGGLRTAQYPIRRMSQCGQKLVRLNEDERVGVLGMIVHNVVLDLVGVLEPQSAEGQ